MNSRERNLIVATAIMVLVGGFFHFFYDDMSDSLAGGGGGSLAAAEQEFETYAELVRMGPDIRGEYQRLTLNVPESRPGQRPADVFVDELSRMLVNDFEQTAPRIDSPPRMSPIPKVEDYYFVDATVHVNGPVLSMIRLLAQMEQRGLLIKDFRLDRRGGGRYGASPDVTLDVTVSRLVQHDDVSRRQMARRRNL